MSLEARLRALRAAGRKILAPYLVCGHPSPAAFAELATRAAEAGADLLEIGIPFSDPLMDGPIIQAASEAALRHEVRPPAALRAMEGLDPGIPFVFMTYVNPVLALGEDAFARRAASAGAAGVIVPDLPVEEADVWVAAASRYGLAPIFLVAPTTPRKRVEAAVLRGGGFVYCVSLLGVTGIRTSLSERARGVVERVREITDRPALVGLGISKPEHAADASRFADGVVVGSAVVECAAKGGADAALRLIADMRRAMDGAANG